VSHAEAIPKLTPNLMAHSLHAFSNVRHSAPPEQLLDNPFRLLLPAASNITSPTVAHVIARVRSKVKKKVQVISQLIWTKTWWIKD
jgi:hypothetical protein